MDTKSFKFDLKTIDEQGLFEGYAAVFGNKDRTGDVIEPGAFTKTIQENPKIPILWQHNPAEPVGLCVAAVEDGKGLRVKGQLNLETSKGREAYALMKQGVLRGLSIGYDTVKEAWDGATRRLKEIRLWEWSLVTFPANPLAQVESIKAVVPYQDLPLAELTRSWDAAAATKRVREWAGDDWDKYSKAFLWYDSENPEVFSSYKLPIADVVDGKLMAIPRGIFAAAAAIQGARGGVKIPESDMAKVKSNIAKYYKKMDREPPWAESNNSLICGIIEAGKEKQAIERLQALLDAEPDESTQKKEKEPLFDELIDDLKFIKEVFANG